MANELQEFLKLLGRIVTWIFKATLNLICFCLFLISLLALWRTYWIIKHIAATSTMKDFRKTAAMHFFLIIIDILVLPFGLVALMIPTRTYHIIKDISYQVTTAHQGDELNAYYLPSVRLILFGNFWIGIFGDMFCLFWGLLSLLIPTRTIAFFRVCAHHFNDYKRDDYYNLRKALCYNFLFALCDIISIPHGIISLLFPTRTYLIITQFKTIYNDRRITYQHPDTLNYTMEYRHCAIKSFYLGLIDLLIIAMAVLSCIFVVRIHVLISLFGKYNKEYKQDTYGDLRIAVCINLVLSIIDLFCLFCGIIVFISCIRTYPLISNLQSYFRDEWEPNDIIFTEYRFDYNIKLRQNIFKHFAFLFIDILFVPLLLLCLLSVYQGIELYHLIKDAPKYDEERMNLIRKKVVLNFITLIFDILCITPLLIIIVVTIYRFPALYNHIKDTWDVYYFNRSIDQHHTFQQEAIPLKQNVNEATSLLSDDQHKIREPANCRIHICMNVLVIVCDIIFIIPSLLLICITCYRIPYLFNVCGEDNIQNNIDNDYMEEYNAIYRQRRDILITTCFIFVDIPCGILCIIVFISVWRAFKLYGLLMNQTTNASEFRKHSFFEFLYLLRDIICLIPFLCIVATLIRLPILILKIMSKLRTPRTSFNDMNLKIEAASLEFQEKGKPRIWIHKATKSAHFALNNDVAKSGYLRLFVLGDAFWNDISDIFGSAISTAGQSQLPNKLSHGINQKSGLNYGTSNGLDYDLITDQCTELHDIPFEIQQFIGKRKTILKNLNKFSDIERRFLFQLEHDEYGILFVIAVSIHDLIECAQSETGFYTLKRNDNFDLSLNDINAIRGNTESTGGIVDMFWIIVCIECIKLLNDITHFILFLVLICIPWRFIQCMYYICCHEMLWSLYQESYIIGVLQHSYFIYIKLYDLLFEPMLNDMVKMSFSKKNGDIQYEKWCNKIETYWNEYQDSFKINSDIEDYDVDNDMKYMNFVSLGLSSYNVAVKQSVKKLKYIKPAPPTKPLIMDLFNIQNIRIYLKIMQSKSNIMMLRNHGFKWEHHSIFIEQIHSLQKEMKQQMVDLYQEINDTFDQRIQESTKYKKTKCGVLSKNLSLTQRIIRFFVYKALVDLVVIIGAFSIILLLCLPFLFDGLIYQENTISILYTVLYYIVVLCFIYYVIPFSDMFHLFKFKYYIRRSGLRFGFKQIMFNRFKMILNDLWTLLQFIMYTILIIITLVRLFEFISELVDGGRKHGKTKLTLRLAKNIAVHQVKFIWTDLYQLFNLFFMWKTYKFAITSAVFGILLPAAGFIQVFAIVCYKCPRKLRQVAAIALWFGFLIVVFIIITASPVHVASLYTVCFVSLGFCFTFFVSLFVFITIDKDDIQRYTRSEYQKIDYNNYYINKLCNVCGTKCTTLDNTKDHYRNHCNICSRYLYRNRSYACSRCDTLWCINCGNVMLQSFQTSEKKDEDNKDTNSVDQMLWSFGSDEFLSFWIRLTWPNAVALIGIVIDFLLMSSILFYMLYMESAFDDLYSQDYILQQFVALAQDILLHPKLMTQQQFNTISIISLIVGGLWVILVSLPLVCEQLFGWVHRKGTFTQSTMWIKATWIYQTFFVVIIVFLIKLFQCNYVDDRYDGCMIISSYSIIERDYYYTYSSMSIVAVIFVIFFWFTSSICNVYNNIQICWSSTDNLDIRYPMAFIHCLQILQSVYIISGMLLVLNNVQFGLLLCCILSWIMLLWNIFYSWISRFMLRNKNNVNILYNFTSVPYFVCFQIMMYCLLTYISTSLYLYLYVLSPENNDNIPSLGVVLQYGVISIIILGFLIMFSYRYMLHKQRLKKLHRLTKLNEIIKSLTNLYQQTSQYGSMDNWYNRIGKMKLQKFTNNIWSNTTDLTFLLIEFERHILYNRLDNTFLQNRNQWIMQLLLCDSINNDSFDDFIPLIDRLRDSIRSPPFFTLCLKALCEESYLFSTAPLDICLLIMDFIVPSAAQIRLVANNTLLDTDQLPVFNTRKGIIKRMVLFGKDCDSKLNQFVQDITSL